MEKSSLKIQKITSKGQITVPVAWRRRVKTNAIVLKTKGDTIEISPARLARAGENEYTVFDALRDNKGKGLRASDLIKILKRIDR